MPTPTQIQTVQHTAGPWIVDDSPDSGLIFIRSHPSEVSLANIRKSSDHPNEANARLIAAAPAMLEALKTIADAQANDDMQSINWSGIRSVIARANGETT